MKPPISPGALALGIYIRRWRLENRYSQRGFGILVGKKQVTIGEIERGENHITLDLIMMLARAMDKDPLELAAVYFMSDSERTAKNITARLIKNAKEGVENSVEK